MKFLIGMTCLLMAISINAREIKFKAGMAYEKCWHDHGKRICEIHPLKGEIVSLKMEETPFAFYDQKRFDPETRAEFAVYIAVVYFEEDDLYDFHIAVKSKADGEYWNHNKVRVNHPGELNELTYHGLEVRSGIYELNPTVVIAPL